MRAVLICLLTTLLGPPSAVADVEMTERAPAASSQDVEDRYKFDWLDPDKKIYVLQNRRYRKARRMMLSGLFGFGLSDSYRNVYNVEPRISYFMSESWGFEAFFVQSFHRDNSTFEALQNAAGTLSVLPVIREIKNQVGANIQWVPWYAKINVFNTILYFDWYLSAGLGALSSEVNKAKRVGADADIETQNDLGLFLGTGHMFHLGDSSVVRLDFKGVFYQAPKFATSGDEIWFSNYNFSFGFGIKI